MTQQDRSWVVVLVVAVLLVLIAIAGRFREYALDVLWPLL